MSGRAASQRQSDSTRPPDSLHRGSLRRNNSADRVASRQHNAAMIHFSRGDAELLGNGQALPLNQRSTTGGTPVRHGLSREFGVTLAANPCHV